MRHRGRGPWSGCAKGFARRDLDGRGEVWRAAEDRAASYLAAEGMTILDRNWSDRLGELDIVARDGDELVFVEVRGLRTDRFVRPSETVTWAKQRRVAQTAVRWLARHPASQAAVRFDVIGFTLESQRLEHIVRAFIPGDLGAWPR